MTQFSVNSTRSTATHPSRHTLLLNCFSTH